MDGVAYLNVALFQSQVAFHEVGAYLLHRDKRSITHRSRPCRFVRRQTPVSCLEVAHRCVPFCSLAEESLSDNGLEAIRTDQKVTSDSTTVLERGTDTTVRQVRICSKPLRVEHLAIRWEVLDHGLLEVVAMECDEGSLVIY